MSSRLALGLIIAPTDREAEVLDRLLSGRVTDWAYAAQKNINIKGIGKLTDAFDGIFITITGENAKCEEVAKKYGAIVSHCDWHGDFSEARNFNWSQIPDEYDWYCWFDADDVVRKPELFRDLVAKCEKDGIDEVYFKYLYEFDEYGNCTTEQLKPRLIRNDRTTKWVAELHESFEYTKATTPFLNQEIEVIHLSDTARKEQSARRNLQIAEAAVVKNPKDPKTYWNLATTYMWTNRTDDAIKLYLQFIEISGSDEEKFLSWFRLSSMYFKKGQLDFALAAALEAMSLRPWYPDPYFLLGEINLRMGRLKHAEKLMHIGMKQDVPELEAIAYNPMDYKFAPNLLLAEIYTEMSKHKEALKHYKKCLEYRPKHEGIAGAVNAIETELAKFKPADDIVEKAKVAKNKKELKALLDMVPVELRHYPPIVAIRNEHFIKTESTGKDIAVFCSFTEVPWNPEVADTSGVGGSEEAVIQLAKRFVKAGYNVTVFCSVPRYQEKEFEGVWYKPYTSYNLKDKYDITVIWRHPKLLDYNLNSEKIYIDMHDVVPKEEFTTARVKRVTKVLAKSNIQRDHFNNVPDDKIEVIPHGLDVEEFDALRPTITKDPYHILNTSSPDRGLKTCLKAIKLAYDKLPTGLKEKLKFSWYYGFDVWDGDFGNDADMQKWKAEALAQLEELKKLGVVTKDSGPKISQREITKKYLEAGLLLYPSEFQEIGFISGMKAQLAGCIPLTTDVFAQGEFMKGIKIHSEATKEKWTKDIRSGLDYGVENVEEVADKIVEYITNVDKYEPMRQECIDFAKKYTWDLTASKWIDLWKTI